MLGLLPNEQLAIYPVRIGVQFKHLDKLLNQSDGGRTYSDTFFFGGSWWTLFLQRFPVQAADEREKWGVFLRRSEGKQLTAMATTSTASLADGSTTVVDPFSGSQVERSVSYYHDRRRQVRAAFKLFNAADKSFEPIFESRPNDFAETQSWGYRSRDHVVSELDVEALRVNGSSSITVRLSLVLRFL
jgi:hypothetical protein